MYHRLREFLGRPVPWGATILSYGGIMVALFFTFYVNGTNDTNTRAVSMRNDQRIERVVAQVRSEGERREDEFCTLAFNQHENAKFRLRTERKALANSKEYVRTGEDVNLVRRVRETLPLARQRVADAARLVDATSVPEVCAPRLERK